MFFKEVQPDIWMWSAYQRDKGYNFNGTLVIHNGEKVIIDPVLCDEPEFLKALKDKGPFEAIYLTNRDHERMAYVLRDEFKIPIFIHHEDQTFLKEKPDATFQEGDKLKCDLEVVHFKNQKSPGESGFYLRKRKIMILGDALIGSPPGSLKLLPVIKYANGSLAKESLKSLMNFEMSALLLGDGEPVLGGVQEALQVFFDHYDPH